MARDDRRLDKQRSAQRPFQQGAPEEARRASRMIKVDMDSPDPDVLQEAARILQNGGLVAFPTETVYGLGANALSPTAVRGIFRAKGRPADNPLIVHVADLAEALPLVANWPSPAQQAAEAFWPGPLTLVLPAASHIPPVVTAGLTTIAIRIPVHPLARALFRHAGVPVAAPSANRSGRPSPTRAEHVWEDLNGYIDLVLDGGQVGIGVESTVLDVSVDPPLLLRPGGVTREDLQRVLGRVEIDPATIGDEPTAVPRSPGLKYRHYAPSCPALVVEGPLEERGKALLRLAREERTKGRNVGVIATAETAALLGAIGGDEAISGETIIVRVTGPLARPELYAARLFDYLRELEAAGTDIILMEGIDSTGIGLAVMNRVRKAAGFRIVRAGEGVERRS